MEVRADPAPLASWTFSGQLRQYQADVLQRVTAGPVDARDGVSPFRTGPTLELALRLEGQSDPDRPRGWLVSLEAAEARTCSPAASVPWS